MGRKRTKPNGITLINQIINYSRDRKNRRTVIWIAAVCGCSRQYVYHVLKVYPHGKVIKRKLHDVQKRVKMLLRHYKGRELAAVLGVSQETVSRWKNGKQKATEEMSAKLDQKWEWIRTQEFVNTHFTDAEGREGIAVQVAPEKPAEPVEEDDRAEIIEYFESLPRFEQIEHWEGFDDQARKQFAYLKTRFNLN